MKIKAKIMNLLHNLWERIDYGIRWACYGIFPAGRLIIILTFFLLYGILAIYVTVSSIYLIGKQDAEREFLELQHIESLKLQNDSINILNQKQYETDKLKIQ
jgi:hypothetical protein